MEDKIIELISNYQGIDKGAITIDSSLIKDLGLSSYDVLDLSCQIEDMFNVEVPDEKIANLETIRDIVDLLEKNV